MSFFENTKKPEGTGGKIMLIAMNLGHSALANWGISFLDGFSGTKILDCGCGGGANIKKLLKKYPKAKVDGVDHSVISVRKALLHNLDDVMGGRCEGYKASIDSLPLEDSSFDLVTAFETVYFWQDLHKSFCEIHRVLKSGGTFLICNECNGENKKGDKWTKIIDGMTIYKDVELKTAIEHAGFYDICIHKNKKGWLCVTARK